MAVFKGQENKSFRINEKSLRIKEPHFILIECKALIIKRHKELLV